VNRPASLTESRLGLGYAITSYVLWGLLPLYFVFLAGLNPFEIVAWRILLSLLFCAVLLTISRKWAEIGVIFRDRALLGRLALAGAVIYVNWQTYVIASTSGHVLDASLGYFINPVITVLLAVFLLGEKLSKVQWLAIATTLVAFGIIAVGFGRFPWVAVLLALSFGFYGYMKKGIFCQVFPERGVFLRCVCWKGVGTRLA